jgi:hypothetical protein
MADGSPKSSPPSPPVLARAALERVLARAAELQSRSEGSDDNPPLTEAQLIELANEVGLSRDHVRQALAEERSQLDVAPESGIAYSMLGNATIQTARTVPGDVASVLASLDSWMQRNESLQVKRRFPDQLSWEPRQGFLSRVMRKLSASGRPFSLAEASDVHAIVVSVEGKKSHARIVARFDDARAARSNGALVAVGAGVIVGVPAFWMAMNASLPIAAALSLIPALGLPMLAVSLTRSAYRRFIARAQVALEQALDRLEYGESARRGP